MNETTEVNDAGETISQARDPLEMEALRELVSSAVGFDEDRGDIITIKSMALQSVAPSGTIANGSLMDQFDVDFLSAIQMLVLAVVTLVLGLFVIRPVLTRQIPAEVPALDAPSPAPGAPAALSGEVTQQDGTTLPALMDAEDMGTNGARDVLPATDEASALSADPVDRLRNMIGERQEETVEILRGWLEDKEEKV